MILQRRGRLAIAVTAALVAVGATTTVRADNGTNTAALRDAVKVGNIMDHLEEFQLIADGNGGNRAAGTAGHIASATYVIEQLEAAGYDPVIQEFSYDKTVVDEATLAQVSPNPKAYVSSVAPSSCASSRYMRMTSNAFSRRLCAFSVFSARI